MPLGYLPRNLICHCSPVHSVSVSPAATEIRGGVSEGRNEKWYVTVEWGPQAKNEKPHRVMPLKKEFVCLFKTTSV
jgi:hypothetical protein